MTMDYLSRPNRGGHGDKDDYDLRQQEHIWKDEVGKEGGRRRKAEEGGGPTAAQLLRIGPYNVIIPSEGQ